MPLHRRDGSYFGTLCALDPLPHDLSEDDLTIFELLSGLIAFELEADERQRSQEAMLRTLEDFIAIASHDLRQPLTIMYGWAQLLHARVTHGDEIKDLANISESLLSSAHEAILLSETLLDTARIEAGSFALEKGVTDLARVVERAVQDARSVAPHHDIVVDAPASVPLRADEARLGQVVRNLLDNAVKYAPPESGPITVQLVAPEADASAAVSMIVRDCGAGVSDDELPLLFDRQFRSPSAAAKRVRGSGLGLYVVRQIVEAHGGNVWAEHAESGGLCVRLTLPIS